MSRESSIKGDDLKKFAVLIVAFIRDVPKSWFARCPAAMPAPPPPPPPPPPILWDAAEDDEDDADDEDLLPMMSLPPLGMMSFVASPLPVEDEDDDEDDEEEVEEDGATPLLASRKAALRNVPFSSTALNMAPLAHR